MQLIWWNLRQAGPGLNGPALRRLLHVCLSVCLSPLLVSPPSPATTTGPSLWACGTWIAYSKSYRCQDGLVVKPKGQWVPADLGTAALAGAQCVFSPGGEEAISNWRRTEMSREHLCWHCSVRGGKPSPAVGAEHEPGNLQFSEDKTERSVWSDSPSPDELPQDHGGHGESPVCTDAPGSGARLLPRSVSSPLLPPWCLMYCLCMLSLPYIWCALIYFTHLWLPQRHAPSKTEARYLPPSIKCLCGRHLVGWAWF